MRHLQAIVEKSLVCPPAFNNTPQAIGRRRKCGLGKLKRAVALIGRAHRQADPGPHTLHCPHRLISNVPTPGAAALCTASRAHSASTSDLIRRSTQRRDSFSGSTVGWQDCSLLLTCPLSLFICPQHGLTNDDNKRQLSTIRPQYIDPPADRSEQFNFPNGQ